jgi:putative oxidoreductase
MSAPDQSPAVGTRPSTAKSVTTWIAQVVLGLTIAGGGVAKLAGDAAMVEMFGDIGAGQWLRVFVGVCEVAGGLGLLVPRVRTLAALGLLVLLLGAVFTNVAILDTSPLLPLGLAAVAVAILWVRRVELPWAADRPGAAVT